MTLQRPPLKDKTPDPTLGPRERGLFAWALLAVATQWVELAELAPVAGADDRANLLALRDRLRDECHGVHADMEPPLDIFTEARWLRPAQLAALAGALTDDSARAEARRTLLHMAGLWQRLDAATIAWTGKPDVARLHIWMKLWDARDAARDAVLAMAEIGQPRKLVDALKAEAEAVGAADALHWMKKHPRQLDIHPGAVKLGLRENWDILMHGVRRQQDIVGRRWLKEHPDRFEILAHYARVHAFLHHVGRNFGEGSLNEYSRGPDILARLGRYAGRPPVSAARKPDSAAPGR